MSTTVKNAVKILSAWSSDPRNRNATPATAKRSPNSCQPAALSAKAAAAKRFHPQPARPAAGAPREAAQDAVTDETYHKNYSRMNYPYSLDNQNT